MTPSHLFLLMPVQIFRGTEATPLASQLGQPHRFKTGHLLFVWRNCFHDFHKMSPLNGCSILFLEIYIPAKFTSNYVQTQPN